jgi:hypothetical protein
MSRTFSCAVVSIVGNSSAKLRQQRSLPSSQSCQEKCTSWFVARTPIADQIRAGSKRPVFSFQRNRPASLAQNLRFSESDHSTRGIAGIGFDAALYFGQHVSTVVLDVTLKLLVGYTRHMQTQFGSRRRVLTDPSSADASVPPHDQASADIAWGRGTRRGMTQHEVFQRAAARHMNTGRCR